MSTYVVVWEGSPIGTVASVEAGKEWCQSAANRYVEDVLPLAEWKHYLSRGTGPGTAHYITTFRDAGTFEVWVIGNLEGK